MKRKTGFLVPLSPQNLLDCSTSDGNLGCRGGYISKSYNYIIRNGGVDSESFYPYEHQVFISRSRCSCFSTLSPSAPQQLARFCRKGSAGTPTRERQATALASTSSHEEMRRP